VVSGVGRYGGDVLVETGQEGEAGAEEAAR